MPFLATMTTVSTGTIHADRHEAMRALERQADASRLGEWSLEVLDTETGERWTRSHASGWVRQ